MSFPRLCCSWHNSLGDLDLLLRSKSASRLLCTFQNLFFPSLYPSLVTVGWEHCLEQVVSSEELRLEPSQELFSPSKSLSRLLFSGNLMSHVSVASSAW
ncbi:unnamed protein product [Brassica oleracea]